MPIVKHEQVVDVPLEVVWAVVKDFSDFLRWAKIPGEIEGEGIGMIRHMDTPDMGKWAEKLDIADNATKTYGYTLVYGEPIGMAKYTARVRLEPGDTGHTNLVWRGEFEPGDGHDADAVAAMLKGAYGNMSSGIEAEAKKQ